MSRILVAIQTLERDFLIRLEVDPNVGSGYVGCNAVCEKVDCSG